jgi:hypothetical protein
MKNNRIKLGIALAAVSVVGLFSSSAAFAAPAAPPAAADAKGYDGFVDFIVGAGSDTTYPLEQEFETLYNRQNGCILSATDVVPASAVQNEYNECSNGSETVGDTETENWDHDVVVNAFPAGSGAGVRQLADGNTGSACDSDPAGYDVDFSRSSADSGTGGIFDCLTYLGYAKDGLAILTFGGRAPLNFNIGGGGNLDLANIFANGDGNCTTRTWGQLLGTADPTIVQVYGIQTSSGTYITFNNAIPGDPNACATAQGHAPCFENNVTTNPTPGCNAANLNNANAIWWGSYGDLATFAGRRGTASLGNGVGGVTPSANSIRGVAGAPFFDPVYPLTRFLWHVNRTADIDADGTFNATYTAAAGGRQGATAALSEWMCRAGGAAAHGIDPNTGLSVDTVLASKIASNNFVRTPTQQIGVNPYGRCLVDY